MRRSRGSSLAGRCGFCPNRRVGRAIWIVRYNSTFEAVEVISDPFGLHAMYAAETKDQTYIATSAMVLGKHLQAKADSYAMTAFLRSEFHFGK